MATSRSRSLSTSSRSAARARQLLAVSSAKRAISLRVTAGDNMASPRRLLIRDHQPEEAREELRTLLSRDRCFVAMDLWNAAHQDYEV
jgi:hypothetical protein